MVKQQRVFVTGIGAISPIGAGWDTTWNGLLAGRSAIRKIEGFDASSFETQIAAEIRWDQARAGDPSEGDPAGEAIRLGLAAAEEALERSGLDGRALQGPRASVFMGCGTGVDSASQAQAAELLAQAASEPDQEVALLDLLAQRFDRRRGRWASPEAPAAALAARYGVQGPVRTHLTACAASAQAIGEAFYALSSGRVDRALAGGAHAMVHPDGIMAFSRLGALSTRNEDPAAASRPFDETRDGFVMGEGAAVLVLETEAAAEARGATALAEVLGYGVTTDGFRATDPDPEATHVAGAIRRALEIAGLEPGAIDYVNAHGTSTQANDAIESKALRMALGDRAGLIPVSSVKSMIGHLIAAAGAMEAAVTAQALAEGRIPPTINLANPDPACPLDYVTEGARTLPIQVALSNSFGFGGQNVCLALRKA